MPGPRQSLDDYLRERIAQLHQLGGVVRAGSGLVDEEAGAWGTVHGTVTFGEFDLGFLSVFEDVERDPLGHPHRTKYSYHCAYDQSFLFRYDFDPVPHRDMPYHKHLPPDERRVESDRVTLQDVIDELWPLVTDRDEAHRDEQTET